MIINDIKFMNSEGYLLKENTLSLNECESQMRKIQYDLIYNNYRGHKDENGVEKTQFPSVIFAFYNIVFNHSKIPSPSELLDEYYSIYSSEIITNENFVTYKNRVFNKQDLDARILRTYPSLVRDYHFYLLLVETGCFDKVIYSCKNDIAGKDLLVCHYGKEYVLSLFVKTRRSDFFKTIKNSFRHNYGKNEIQLPLDLNKATKCGDFFVYDNNDVEKVKTIIL